jgi:hypothetical protein
MREVIFMLIFEHPGIPHTNHLQEATTLQTREGDSLTAHELLRSSTIKVSALVLSFEI